MAAPQTYTDVETQVFKCLQGAPPAYEPILIPKPLGIRLGAVSGTSRAVREGGRRKQNHAQAVQRVVTTPPPWTATHGGRCTIHISAQRPLAVNKRNV